MLRSCRHLPQEAYEAQSLDQPLISRRWEDDGHGLAESLPLLEQLLQCQNKSAHEAIADTLWRAESDADAVVQLRRLADEQLRQWNAEEQGNACIEAVSEG